MKGPHCLTLALCIITAALRLQYACAGTPTNHQPSTTLAEHCILLKAMFRRDTLVFNNTGVRTMHLSHTSQFSLTLGDRLTLDYLVVLAPGSSFNFDLMTFQFDSAKSLRVRAGSPQLRSHSIFSLSPMKSSALFFSPSVTYLRFLACLLPSQTLTLAPLECGARLCLT